MNDNTRFQDLERKYSQLGEKLDNTPVKEAISVLHAMILESRRAESPQGVPPESGPTMEAVANLYKIAPDMVGEAETEGLKVGAQAPDFTLLDKDARKISLSDFKGKNVVLAFYPLDWSPACSDQLSLYQDDLQDFKKYNTQVIGVSVDSIYSHGAWATVRGIEFPLLADFHPKGEVARQYKVFRDSDGFSERALYVIDAQGVIRYKKISPQLDHIPDIYELFDQLRTLQAQAEQASA